MALTEQQKQLNYDLNDACSDGDLEKVKELISNGANVNYRCSFSKWVIGVASENGHLDIVKYLQYNGADLGYCILDDVVENGHLDVAKYLIESGEDYKLNNNQVLILASRSGHLDIVKYLVENGADVNSVGEFNHPVIIYASHKGHLEVVKYLHQNGADLDVAIEVSNPKMKEELIAYKTSLEEKALLTNDLKEIKQEQKPKNTMRI